MENLRSDEKLKEAAEHVAADRGIVIDRFFGRSGVDERHNFSISTPLEVTVEQADQLSEIAGLFTAYVNGLSRIVALATIDDKKRRVDPDFRKLRRRLGIESLFGDVMNSPKRDPERKNVLLDEVAEKDALSLDVSGKHPFGRFDIVLDPHSGRMQAVEIEVGKFHGFGYSTLCRSRSESLMGKGVANLLSELSSNNPVLLILSKDERFYEVESEFLAREVNALGGNLKVIAERDLDITDKGINGVDFFNEPIILGLPKLGGKNCELLEDLAHEKKVKIVSANSSVLGEKSSMALITNANDDPFVEGLLGSVFDQEDLKRLREIIPFTQIPTSRDEVDEVITAITKGDSLFVKVVDSSGARGVAGPDRKDRQVELLRGNGKRSKVVVQRAIEPHIVRLPFVDLRNNIRGVDDFSLRYGLFTFGNEVLDLAITASPGIVAHGGKESIQTGIKVVDKLSDNGI